MHRVSELGKKSHYTKTLDNVFVYNNCEVIVSECSMYCFNTNIMNMAP